MYLFFFFFFFFCFFLVCRKGEGSAGREKAGLSVVEVKEKRGWECIVCKKA